MAGMRQYGQKLARGMIRGSRGLLRALPVRAITPAETASGPVEASLKRLRRPSPKWPKHNDAAFLAYGLAAERGGFQCG